METSKIVIAAIVTMTTVSLDRITGEIQITRLSENIYWKINVKFLDP